MNGKKIILITGSHRSGTTWIGKMIASAPFVGYIHEPFNPAHNTGICAACFERWFTYITNDNQSRYYEHIANTLEFRYNILEAISTVKSVNDFGRKIRDYKNFTMNKILNVRPLMKDPIAIFSAEWLGRTFDMNVLIVIRHPAAFVSSLKKLNWGFQFSNLLYQPLLMKDLLYPFEAEIEDFVKNKYDIIDQGILLWRVIHHVIIKYQADHKDWIFLKHEDISRDPLGYFQEIFRKFNLDFTSKIEANIQKFSDPSNPIESPENEGSMFIKRNSKSGIWNWKNRLTKEEIKRIRSRGEDIASEFYSDNDW